jgi:hypothetical protein
MDTIAIITKARQSPQVTELLTRICDFAFVEPGVVDLGVQLQSGHHPNVIAQDASGGMFALCQANDTGRQPVLYVSSEGEAGIIARDLAAALQTVIQLPYWRDCLKFSGGGRLDEMHKAISYLEHELSQDEAMIDAYRKTLLATLELEQALAPVDMLYQAVVSTAEICGVITQDGSVLQSLFNAFVVSDNPMWRAMRANHD